MISRSVLLLSSCLILLGACTATPVDHHVVTPQLTYEHVKPISVDISSIDFLTDTQRGAQPWDISNDMPTPPDVAMRRYLEQRYEAVGANGTLKIELKKADIHHESVPQDNPFMRYISFANEQEYTFEIIVDLATKYLSGKPDRTTSLRFVRVEKIAPQATLAYREARLQRVLEEIIRDIDTALINEFAHEFNIVRDSDIPKSSIEVRTKIPEEKTAVTKSTSDRVVTK